MDTQFENKRPGKAGTDIWLTPPQILKALGEFDLDPCAPIVRPWEIAKRHYTEIDNGLFQIWEGRVFCNPPYGRETKHWLDKCAMHGNAIALTFARTETGMFFSSVWPVAHSVFFIKGRVSFFKADGTEGGTAGAPSILIAYDEANSEVLRTCKIKGKYIRLNK